MDYIVKYWPIYAKIGGFLLGTGIAIHEVFMVDESEPAILGFAALCLGLVAAANLDSLRNKIGSDK